jgi:hypothetical protein
MYKITNIETLGTEYTVANTDGKVLGNIQIIPHTEILEAALGPCTAEFSSFTDYIEKSRAVLEGNEDIDPHSIYWFSTEDEEVPLEEIIEHAVKYGYSIIILEQLDPVLH